jgi:medium-chain acyl-[acyl-carrier-protein] hydrolase
LSDCKLIQEICRRYDGIPAEILADQEFLAAVLGTIRADMRVVESYVRTGIRPLGCSITAFAGERDRTVSIGEVEQWKDQTSAAFSMVLLDEDHLYLQSARKQLVETIRDTLLNANCVR